MKRALLLCLLWLVAACQAPGSTPPDPAAELRQAATALGSVKTVTADVKFTGGLVFQGFTLDSATARIKLPNASDTVIKVKQQDFLVDLEVISVDGHIYFKAPFTRFQEITAADAAVLPDLAALFDPAKGLPAVMASGRSAHLDGSEKVRGVDCHPITTTYTADELRRPLGG